MKLNELQPSEGSLLRSWDVAVLLVTVRSGRQKGQKARSKTRLGFEGGQMPLYRRIPKRGFTNINRKEFAVVNLAALNVFDDGAEVTPATLVEAGIVKNEKSGVKILGNGELTKKLTVKAAKFSKSAAQAIEVIVKLRLMYQA